VQWLATQHILYAVNMGRMEGDVVYCPQNAMFVLPRKMFEDSLLVVHVSQKCGIYYTSVC